MRQLRAVAVGGIALGSLLPGPSVAQVADAPSSAPLFADVWIGGGLDSIYNAEYQRVQAACRGAGDDCYASELDTTAVAVAPVFADAGSSEPSGWLVARLRPRGAWPYAALLFRSADGAESTVVEDLGDWGYGVNLDLVEARGSWMRPWMLDAVGGHWIGPDGGPGLGVVDGPYGLEGRLWTLDPTVVEPGSVPSDEVYMVLDVSDGVVRLRREVPTDMDCGGGADPAEPAPEVSIHEVPLSAFLDVSGRSAFRVAYGKGC